MIECSICGTELGNGDTYYSDVPDKGNICGECLESYLEEEFPADPGMHKCEMCGYEGSEEEFYSDYAIDLKSMEKCREYYCRECFSEYFEKEYKEEVIQI